MGCCAWTPWGSCRAAAAAPPGTCLRAARPGASCSVSSESWSSGWRDGWKDGAFGLGALDATTGDGGETAAAGAGCGDAIFLACEPGPSTGAGAAAAPPFVVGGIALRSVMTRLSESSISEPFAAGAAAAFDLLFDRPALAVTGGPAGDLALRGFWMLVADGARVGAPVAAAPATVGAEFCLVGAAGRGALRPVACWPECDLRRLTAAPPPPPPPAITEAGGVEDGLPAVGAAAAGAAASFLAAPGPRLRALGPPRRALLPALPFEVLEFVREAAGAVGLTFEAAGTGVVGCGPVEVEVGGGASGAGGALAGSDMAGTVGSARSASGAWGEGHGGDAGRTG